MVKKSIALLAVCLCVLAAPNVRAQTQYVPDTGALNERVCSPRSYTDLGNGVIQDNVTGLQWQQATVPVGRTWSAADDYCDTLNFAGHADWRLPTIAELETLVDHGRYDPATSPVFDMVAERPRYWSSDSYVHATGSAWYVDFRSGRVDKEYGTYTNSVRAVRGQLYGALANFVSNGNGMVTDTATGLMWQQCKAGQTWDGTQCKGSADVLTWTQAVAYIKELKDTGYLGHRDWRLPTRNELQTLVDYSRYNPATLFPDTETNYWSATAWAGDSSAAWEAEFIDGIVSVYYKSSPRNVRAVRGGLCVQSCKTDEDCDDGAFCNGIETCADSTCIEGASPCAAGDYCVEANDDCVECLKDKHCAPGYSCVRGACVFGGPVQITTCTVKAGKIDNADSIQLAGFLDATGADFISAEGGNVVVTLKADYIPDLSATTYAFPVNEASYNNGKYISPKVTPANKTDPLTSFAFDTNTGTMKFSAKNVDLAGLSCPITFKVRIGEYSAEAQMEEDIVNGTKPCPLALLMGVKDSLNVLKAKARKGTTAAADSISISGTFTVNGSFDTGRPVVITLGPDTFTVPGGQFAAANGSYGCKSADSGNGLVTAKFDAVKCTYSVSIKNASVSGSGSVDFGIDIFGNPLQAPGQIALPPEF